jgi:Zn-finger nucleic acid-binding protein
MTYLKCVSCRARLYSEASQDDVDGDSCPACGGTLEPVGELAEIVGYHSLGARGDGDRWLDGTALKDLVLPGPPL